MSTTRQCPFCAEDILAKAKLCKHCKSEMPPASSKSTPPEPQNNPEQTAEKRTQGETIQPTTNDLDFITFTQYRNSVKGAPLTTALVCTITYLNSCAQKLAGSTSRATSIFHVGNLIWVTLALTIATTFLENPSRTSTTSKPDEVKPFDKFDTQAWCQEAIKKKMHNPRSADFEHPIRNQLVPQKNGTDLGITSGYFYGTNAFGAKIRNNYYCEVTVDQAKRLKRVDIADIR